MQYITLSVRDEKAATFSQPFYAPTLGHGIRSFLDAVSAEDPNNMMKKHPADFHLYHLGSFNDQSGTFVLKQPELVASATDSVPAKQSMTAEAVQQYQRENPSTKVVGV